MLGDILLVASGVMGGLVLALGVIAPRTKTKVDDKVLDLLNKYGVPLVEYLEAHNQKPAVPREVVRDHRTK